MMHSHEDAQPSRSDVLIVGGGISGLGAAWRLRQAAPHHRITLLEAATAGGGKLVTEHVDGYTIEHGPDIFLARKPWALALCHELGLENDLVPTNPAFQGSFVQLGGQLHPLPPGMSGLVPSRLGPLLSTRLLSPAGKLRLAMEWFVPRRRGGADEALGRFIRRRFGREMHERLMGPLLGGIYGGDVDSLSLKATFPQFHELEAAHGSLLRGARAGQRRESGVTAVGSQASGSSDPVAESAFLSLQGGMQRLPETLVQRLVAGDNPVRIVTSCRVDRVEQASRPNDAPGKCGAPESGPEWRVRAKVGDTGGQNAGEQDAGGQTANDHVAGRHEWAEHAFEAQHVIITTPAYTAADMLGGALADELRGIGYNSSVMVTVGFARDAISHPLDGYGYLVPEAEGKAVRACTWSSSKIAGRAPSDRVLMRFFFGRHAEDPLLQASEQQLLSHVACELVDVLGVAPGVAARPALVRIRRWLRSQPAYTLGHLDRLERVDRLVAGLPGLVLTGSAYRGVGIPDAIRQANEAASRVLGDIQRANEHPSVQTTTT